jgi:hypothetical protein
MFELASSILVLAQLMDRIASRLSGKLLSFQATSSFNGVCLALADPRVDLIHSVERQAQKLMLVVPPHILLFEVFGFLRRWRRVGDLGDKVCSRCLRDTVDEDTKERHFEEEEERNCEAVKHAGAVVEPELLLLRSVADTSEVRIELSQQSVRILQGQKLARSYQFPHQGAT